MDRLNQLELKWRPKVQTWNWFTLGTLIYTNSQLGLAGSALWSPLSLYKCFELLFVYLQIRLYRQMVKGGSQSAASPIQKVYITEQRIKTVLPSRQPISQSEEPLLSEDGRTRWTRFNSLLSSVEIQKKNNNNNNNDNKMSSDMGSDPDAKIGPQEHHKRLCQTNAAI